MRAGRRAGTAAVCVYAAPVAGCPRGAGGLARAPGHGRQFPARRRRHRGAPAEETAAAVAAGRRRGRRRGARSARCCEGDVGLVGELVEACRAPLAGPAITLKVILETGILREPGPDHGAAARAAVMAGVDFLKTSTGKSEVGATLEAAATLLAVMRARPAAGSASRRRAASAPRADAAAYLAARRRDHGAGLGHARAPSASAPPALLDDLLRPGRPGRRAAY